jgi:hypothetical protein
MSPLIVKDGAILEQFIFEIDFGNDETNKPL